MAKRHEGNSIIVTGAAGSIGFATCEILAREGAQLLMVDINGDRLRERAAELTANGHTAIAHVADCADEDAVAGYAKEAITAFGKVDGFFNNAGIEGDLAPTHEYDIAMFDNIIRVNLRSMFLGLRFVIPHMVAAKKGAIVNTASIGSERGLAGHAPTMRQSTEPWG
ncbi:MAG: SDR family NAD(P)-dependent oxidoreductase [Alteraurantiacibacter sp.]